MTPYSGPELPVYDVLWTHDIFQSSFFTVMTSELWISFFHEELKSLESFLIIHHDVIIERNHSIIIKPVAWSISLLVQTLTSSIWSGFVIINLDRWRWSDRGTVKRVTKWWRMKQYLGNNPYAQLVPYFLYIFTEMLFASVPRLFFYSWTWFLDTWIRLNNPIITILKQIK